MTDGLGFHMVSLLKRESVYYEEECVYEEMVFNYSGSLAARGVWT